MSQLSNASSAIDFQGLASLKQQARGESPEAIREVAKQFEAMFTQMMLKSMREASLGEGILDSDQSKLYQSMYDQQLAVEMSSGQGLGFTDMLVRQLGGEPQQPTVGGDRRADGSFAAPTRTMIDQVRAMAPVERPTVAATAAITTQAASTSSSSAPVSAAVSAAQNFATPEQFVKRLWPQAQQAAERIGTTPEVLIAQAALETGWGRSITRNEAGESSNNLFNIKADNRWSGDSTTVSTIEYRGGIALRESASFRSYDSYAESFNDYVDFLSTNPRYSQALEHAANPEAYIEELQKAGYATDPRYADKITNILRGDTLSSLTPSLRGESGGAVA